MKKYTLILLTALISICGTAQTLTMDKVPAAVANAFKQKFPASSQPGWTKAGADIYEVHFFNSKKRQSALFEKSGNWLDTETEINYNALPAKVQRSFETEFEGYQVQEVYELETPDKGIFYELTAFKGTKNFAALYSPKGELLQKDEGETTE